MKTMYYIKKRMEIAGSHRLDLPYDSPCRRLHGHNWIITVYCKSESLSDEGMVVDFRIVKEKIHAVLDHQNINDILPFNPTAENIARWCCEQTPHCYKATVEESEGNMATYIREDKK